MTSDTEVTDPVQLLQAKSQEHASTEPESLNWRRCWYPILFTVDLPSDRPYSFSIFSEPFVLFRDSQAALVCLKDRCPHRLAKLSDGQWIEGRLECLYHGWQFGQNGQCLHIPHLLEKAEIPERANVPAFPVQEQQGIIWVWADAEVAPTPKHPPVVSEVEQPGVFKVDTATDLPFDHCFLVENLLDPAHVYISHDGTELGIRREDAKPLEMEVLSTSVSGIEGRFRRADKPQAPWSALSFQAPMLVHYRFSNPTYGVIGGLALYALPIADGHSRILVRRYGNFFKRAFTLKPRWLEHLRQNKILEEDLAFIVAQDRFFRENDQTLQSAYFPLKTCDTLVMEHRRWLDRFGQNLPWYIGYATTKHTQAHQAQSTLSQLSTRFERHTKHCQACQTAHQRLVWIKRGTQGSGVLLLLLAIATDGWLQLVLLLGVIVSIVKSIAIESLIKRFES